MGPQPRDSFRFFTSAGRRLFVFSAVLAGVACLFLRWLGSDPPQRPFGTGLAPLYSLGIGFGVGIGSFAVGGWFLKRRGINVLDDHDEET
jgi:hypothetical protein